MSTAQLSLIVDKKTPYFTISATKPDFWRVFGAKLDMQSRLFRFPAVYPFGLDVLSDLDIVAEDTSEEYTLDDHAARYKENLLESKKAIEEEFLDPEFEFITEPKEHQRLSLIQAYHMPRFGILLDCGLGKTKVAIDLLRYMKFKGEPCNALVMAPPVVLRKWAYLEFPKHAGDAFSPKVLHGTQAKVKKLFEQDADVTIVSHAGPTSEYLFKHLTSQQYDVAIVDESHKLKTPPPKGALTAAAIDLSQGIPRKYLLSGTPTSGNPLHLYGQLAFLGDFLLPEKNLYMFRRRFLVFLDPKSKDKRRRNIVIGYKNAEILNRRLSKISIKRSKAECLDLPPVQTHDVSYLLAKEQVTLYNDLATSFAEAPPEEFKDLAPKKDEKGEVKDSGFYAIRVNKLAQILSGFYYKKDEKGDTSLVRFKKNPKLDSLKELVESILVSSDNKIVIWAKYKPELQDLKEALSEYNCSFIDGSSPNYDAAIDFDKDPDKRVLIGQISLGEGFDAVSANYMIYYGIDFDLGKYKQSHDRVHRLGQTRGVTVYRFRHPGTVEDFIYDALEFKDVVSNVLTERAYCIVCPDYKRCLAKVLPFEQGCTIPVTGDRVVAKPRRI